MTSADDEFYHVTIKYEGRTLHEVNLVKEFIEIIAKEYQYSPSMLFEGKVIYPNRIEEIFIYRNNQKIERNAFIQMRSFDEVKREFIKRPPARFAYRLTEDLDLKKGGLFIRGEFYDAFNLINNLIVSANNSILLIDSHVDERVLNILQSKKPNISVRILTNRMHGSFETAATNYSAQYRLLEVRTSNVFHDRFLILDDEEYYHFGASFMDAGNKGFMFARIEEPSVISALNNEIERAWSSATSFI